MVDVVIGLLKIRHTPLHKIASDTGVSRSWLDKLIAGQIPEPSIVKVQKLFDYLTKCDR